MAILMYDNAIITVYCKSYYEKRINTPIESMCIILTFRCDNCTSKNSAETWETLHGKH